ncbi:hypothetical protein ScPMuIL_013447 [Solemya velum]
MAVMTGVSFSSRDAYHPKHLLTPQHLNACLCLLTFVCLCVVLSMDFGTSSTKAVHVDFASLSPYPLEIPSAKGLTVNVSVDVLQALHAPVSMEVKIQKKILFWITIPCVSNVGSCTYNACELLYTQFGHAGCPSELMSNQFPCMCPIEPGRYTLRPTRFPMEYIHPVFQWLASGDYKIEVVLKNKNTGAQLGCYKVEVSLKNQCSGLTIFLVKTVGYPSHDSVAGEITPNVSVLHQSDVCDAIEHVLKRRIAVGTDPNEEVDAAQDEAADVKSTEKDGVPSYTVSIGRAGLSRYLSVSSSTVPFAGRLIMLLFLITLLCLGTGSLGVFTFTDCGPSGKQITINRFSIGPDPAVVPGTLTVDLHGTITGVLPKDVKMNVTMEKRLLGRWVGLPCVNNVGTCFHTNACTFLKAFEKSGVCPAQLQAHGLPCTCPFQPRELNLPSTDFQVTSLRQDWSFIASGIFHVRIEILNGNNRIIGCLDTEFQSTSA